MNNLFLEFHQQIMDPQRIPYAISAILIVLVVGAITGPIFGNVYPLLWSVFDKIFGRFGDKLNKAGRSKGDLIFRGFALTVVALLLAFGLGQGFDYLVSYKSAGAYTEILLLSLLLTLGSVWFALLRLYFVLEKKDDLVEGAYYAISRSCRANLNASDDFGITRLAIGLSVRSFDKGIVAPVFWYLMGGLPVATLYCTLAALSWRFGKEGQDKGFGQAPVALEKLMGFVPALLSATIITLASAIMPTAKVGKGIKSWLGMKNRAAYAQGGFPLSVLAWSLNLSLGGPYQSIDGSPIKRAWVGPKSATAKNDYTHLRRALIISFICHALFIVSLASAYMWGSAL